MLDEYTLATEGQRRPAEEPMVPKGPPVDVAKLGMLRRLAAIKQRQQQTQDADNG